MGGKKNVLVCLDRDGTLIYDDEKSGYHLGRQKNWKSLIKILPGVIEGIKRLRKIKGAKIYMITNQPGVAVSDFKLLTMSKAREVCGEILKVLEKKRAGLDGYEICPHVSPAHAKKHRGRKFRKSLVCNCACVKPNIGMIQSALKKEGWKLSETEVYFIGDRVSDVQTGINARGTGILVSFGNTKNQRGEFGKIKSKKKYLAKSFREAVGFVVGKI